MGTSANENEQGKGSAKGERAGGREAEAFAGSFCLLPRVSKCIPPAQPRRWYTGVGITRRA